MNSFTRSQLEAAIFYKIRRLRLSLPQHPFPTEPENALGQEPDLGPWIENFASHALERRCVARDDPVTTGANNGGDERIAEGKRAVGLSGHFSPNRRGARVEVQDSIQLWQAKGEFFDPVVVRMIRF